MAKTSKIARSRQSYKFAVRERNRCKLCGRPRSYMRQFGVCRICFRELASKGQVPGVTKSSW